VRHLELLKMRFGEEQMQLCEVMLKDFADSKRISTRIMEDTQAGDENDENASSAPSATSLEFLRVFILSRLFWPPMRGEDSLEVPANIKAAFDLYSEKFGVLKAARTLDLKAQLGTVSLTLELDSGTEAECTVSPVLATIISHFSDEETWTLKDLSAKMQVTTSVLEKRISFWVNTGLVRLDGPGTYVLDEDGYEQAQQGNTTAAVADPDADREEELADSAQQQKLEELETCWMYIQGMLNNAGALPVDKMREMLDMFVDGGFDGTDKDLQQFLDTKVTEGIVSRSGAEYSLVAGDDGSDDSD